MKLRNKDVHCIKEPTTCRRLGRYEESDCLEAHLPFIGWSQESQFRTIGTKSKFLTQSTPRLVLSPRKSPDYSRGENTRRRPPGCALNWSLRSLQTALPSSQGAKEMSNRDTNNATTPRTSFSANVFPMQLCFPVDEIASVCTFTSRNVCGLIPIENGEKASTFLIRSGWAYHRSGINSKGRT